MNLQGCRVKGLGTSCCLPRLPFGHDWGCTLGSGTLAAGIEILLLTRAASRECYTVLTDEIATVLSVVVVGIAT